jgi:chemotaxis protein MotB
MQQRRIPTQVTHRKSKGIWIPWIVLILLLGGFAGFWLRVVKPMQKDLAVSKENLWAAGKDAQDCEEKQVVVESENQELKKYIQSLEVDNKELQKTYDWLAAEVKRKMDALEALKSTQAELNRKLQREVRRGEILIKDIRGNLVVDVTDRILFDSGEAELNEQGQEVLKKVGETLLQASDKIIQVGGHTDSLPISERLKEEFPSNWELSTARASRVVRFLQEEAKIPGERLVASGFAHFRPAASNATKRGRRLNRRIEIMLLPRVEELEEITKK